MIELDELDDYIKSKISKIHFRRLILDLITIILLLLFVVPPSWQDLATIGGIFYILTRNYSKESKEDKGK